MKTRICLSLEKQSSPSSTIRPGGSGNFLGCSLFMWDFFKEGIIASGAGLSADFVFGFTAIG